MTDMMMMMMMMVMMTKTNLKKCRLWECGLESYVPGNGLLVSSDDHSIETWGSKLGEEVFQ